MATKQIANILIHLFSRCDDSNVLKLLKYELNPQCRQSYTHVTGDLVMFSTIYGSSLAISLLFSYFFKQFSFQGSVVNFSHILFISFYPPIHSLSNYPVEENCLCWSPGPSSYRKDSYLGTLSSWFTRVEDIVLTKIVIAKWCWFGSYTKTKMFFLFLMC